ncbi:hypothetical protein D3C72_1917860 [compost metagenome]
MFDGHHRAFIAGRHAEPRFAVVAGDSLVIFPAVRVGRLACVHEADRARFALRALQAEVKPLRDVGVGILADVQLDGLGIVGAQHLDRAGVELLADFNGHECS